jgi:hypothetical protein
MKKQIAIYCALIASIIFSPALKAGDKAEIDTHCNAYHDAGKIVIAMAITKQIDVAEVKKQVGIMVNEGVWLCKEYAKVHPKGEKFLKTVTDNIEVLRKASFDELQTQWHDLGYFEKKDVGLDLKAEDNEHFTDPIHTVIHPLMVLKAAEAYTANKKEEDLKAFKEEMEEGVEQMEEVRIVLEK